MEEIRYPFSINSLCCILQDVMASRMQMEACYRDSLLADSYLRAKQVCCGNKALLVRVRGGEIQGVEVTSELPRPIPDQPGSFVNQRKVGRTRSGEEVFLLHCDPSFVPSEDAQLDRFLSALDFVVSADVQRMPLTLQTTPKSARRLLFEAASLQSHV